MSVLVETTVGSLVIDVMPSTAPRSSKNFLKLCKQKYFNYNLIFKIQTDFVLSTGDQSDTGKGGECFDFYANKRGDRYFVPEIVKGVKHNKKGVVSFVTTWGKDGLPNAGSQFMITLSNSKLDYLDGMHAIFGQVVEGLEILDKLNAALVDEQSKPYQDIRILHTVILDDQFPDPPGFLEPNSPPPPERVLKSIRDEKEREAEKGMTEEELASRAQQEEIRARALTLEMVGDIVSADLKPPENVLFVCKLNPITRGQDLEIIFGRFGKVLSCEVKRDKIGGVSLGYAFIEFERQKDCEEDNVLIDDRRIKVDFSQSVSRLEESRPQRGYVKSSYGRGLEQKTKYRNERKAGNEYGLVFEPHPNRSDGNIKEGSRSRDSTGRDGGVEDRGRDRSMDRGSRKESRRETGRSRDRN